MKTAATVAVQPVWWLGYGIEDRGIEVRSILSRSTFRPTKPRIQTLFYGVVSPLFLCNT